MTTTSAEPITDSAQTGESEPAVVTRSFSVSCNGCETGVEITATSDRFTADQLDDVLRDTQAVACIITTIAINLELEKITYAEPSAELPEPVSTDSALVAHGVQVDISVTNTFTQVLTDRSLLQELQNRLSTVLKSGLSAGIDELAVAQIRKEHPTPENYLEHVVNDQDTPIEELVPPGLEPNHWQELVRRFAGDCACGHPACLAGVFQAVTSYEEWELVQRGISEEAAAAIVANPTMRLVKERGNDPLAGMAGLADMLGGFIVDTGGSAQPFGNGHHNGPTRRRR
jgi:hypothetical protein